METDKGYILFLSNGFPNEKETGGIFAFDQAKAMRDQGYRVIFASYDLRHKGNLPKGMSEFEFEKIKVYAINDFLDKSNRLRQFLSYRYGKQLLEYIIKENGIPRLIHAHFALSGYIAARFNKKHKIPLIITEHSTSYNKNKIKFFTKKFGSYGHKKADKIIAVSSPLQKNIKKHSKTEAVVIPNIIETDTFNYNPQKTDNFVFVSVGLLIERKGVDLTIKAFHEAFENTEKVKLKIIGSGNKDSEYKNLVKNLSEEHRIEFLGQISRKDIAGIFNLSDCFVLASRKETFGVVYAEALAAGLPVIATDCGGPSDFIVKENGLLIPVDDINCLIEAMKTMHGTADRYNGAKISADTKLKFSSKIIGDEINNIYKQVL